jgi:predicted transcriptional regulator
MATSSEFRSKQKILDVIQRMPEDGTIDDAIYRLNLLKAVAEGLEDAEQGRVYDHDEVFDELSESRRMT